MKDQAFDRALGSLIHPISIGAIGLLLWNDHWLRLHYPSWWSGKIGDFAWLIFAPFICAAVLAWIIPQRLENHHQIVGLAAFLIIGVWFTLAKTVPAVHELTVAAWEAVISAPVSQRLDPTDLCALPALWLGWQVWKRATAPALKRSHLTTVIFALAIFATLASDDGPSYVDAGITTICSEGENLVTYFPVGGEYIADNSNSQGPGYKLTTSSDVYTSSDGGLTWQLTDTIQTEGESQPESHLPTCSKPSKQIHENDQGKIQYRWTPAQVIESSTDGGQHWTTEFDLYQLRQDVRSYYKPSDNSYNGADTSPGPRSGLIDPVTGNVVLAMGWDGILVRTGAGKWQWASVGKYHLDNLSDVNQVVNVLAFELCEAGALISLVLISSGGYLRRDGARRPILFFGWLGWVIIAFLLLPGYHSGNDIDRLFRIGILSLPLALLGIIFTVFALRDFLRNFRKLLLRVLGVGVTAALLYLLPLILWTQGTIPRYLTAMGFALFLSGSALVAGYRYLLPILPVVGPEPTIEPPSP